jgi:two-component system, response regulator RegA
VVDPGRVTKRVMVIDDDPRFVRSLGDWLENEGYTVRTACSVVDAEKILGGFAPEIVLLDFALPDGNAHRILDAMQRSDTRAAVIVISGEARSEEAFELAARGVRQFASKPITPERLKELLDRVNDEETILIAQARASVGQIGIFEAEALVRRTMLEEALDRADGSRRGAARLLSISRQALQHMLRRLP